jgi:microcystin degradation protein MlrC
VLALADGEAVGRLGLYQGRTMRLGRSAALRIGGVTAVVISERYQTADPVIFERLGLDIGTARTAVVKSRGHFRAGFRPWFSPEQVVEVDTAGLTSSALDRRQWHHLPRPIFPLDPDTRWPPAEDAPTAAPSPRGPRG